MEWFLEEETRSVPELKAEQYQDIDYALARLLLNRQIPQKKTITYTDCAAILTEVLRRPVHRRSLRMPLYRVSGMCNALDLPFISTLVVLKNQTNRQQAGEGFYKMAREYRTEYRLMRLEDIWEMEQQRLVNCKDWSKLDEFLKQAGW